MTVLFLYCCLLFGAPSSLNLEITGIEEIEGFIMVAAYSSEDNFLSDNVVASGRFEVTGEKINANLTLPYGQYAISVYHDINGDGELDTKLFGIPKEPVGFTNDARGSFGPPSFEDVLVDFNSSDQTFSIELY